MKVQAVAVGLVGLVIAVIFVGLVAVPVVDDATHGTPFEGTNSNFEERFSYVEDPTLTWGRASNASVSLTYKGTTSTISSESNDVLIVTDKFALRSIATGAQMWDYTNSTYTLSANDPDIVISLTITAGSYSLTYDGTTTTGTVDWALFKDPNGDYGRFSSGFKATVGQTVIMGHLFGTGNGAYNLVEVTDGTVGSYLVDPYTFSGTSIVSQTVEYDVDYAVVGEGQIVGSYTGMTMTYNGTDYDAMRFYAPIDFESTASTESGGINSTLLGIIPMLLIIVAIMIAVRLVRDA